MDGPRVRVDRVARLDGLEVEGGPPPSEGGLDEAGGEDGLAGVGVGREDLHGRPVQCAEEAVRAQRRGRRLPAKHLRSRTVETKGLAAEVGPGRWRGPRTTLLERSVDEVDGEDEDEDELDGEDEDEDEVDGEDEDEEEEEAA